MEVNIRLAKKAEIGAIIDLQTLSILNYSHLISRRYDSKQIEAIAKGQANARKEYLNSEIIFLAEFDRKLIGFIALSLTFVNIDGLFVHPDFMRKGVGTKLLSEVETICIKKKIKKLSVISSLESSVFYLKNGYSYKTDMGFYTQDSIWIQCELLEKVLIPPSKSQRLIQRFMAIALLVALTIILLSSIFS
jgi:N-acetylglutamate synthase-like GNAT family acetyltransferase